MAWGGIASMVILLIGMWAIADFVPPPGPDKSMDEIVGIYVDHGTKIRIGIIVACAGVTLLGPWSVAVAMQMKRIEGNLAPLAWSQVLLGALLLVEFYVPCVLWTAAAFRPEADPGFTYRIHDVASIMFVALPWTGMLQAILLAVAILQDRNQPPVFPRWLAYLSLWAALAFIPGGLNSLAHTGPIAWSGILAWWLGLAVFRRLDLRRLDLPGEVRDPPPASGRGERAERVPAAVPGLDAGEPGIGRRGHALGPVRRPRLQQRGQVLRRAAVKEDPVGAPVEALAGELGAVLSVPNRVALVDPLLGIGVVHLAQGVDVA